MENQFSNSVDFEELAQDLRELSLCVYSAAHAVRSLPGADETLSRGLALNLERLSNEIERVLPQDIKGVVPLNRKKLGVLAEMLTAPSSASAVDLQTARDAAQEIRLALEAMS